MPIYRICYIRSEVVPHRPFSVVLADSVLFAESGKCMPAVVSGMRVVNSDFCKIFFQLFPEGLIACEGKYFSMCLYALLDKAIDAGMDWNDSILALRRFCAAAEVSLLQVYLHRFVGGYTIFGVTRDHICGVIVIYDFILHGITMVS